MEHLEVFGQLAKISERDKGDEMKVWGLAADCEISEEGIPKITMSTHSLQYIIMSTHSPLINHINRPVAPAGPSLSLGINN